MKQWFKYFRRKYVYYQGSIPPITPYVNMRTYQSNSYYFVLVGPIVSGLVNQFGCRKVTVAGSIVAAAGFIIGSFSPNLDVLILTYGVIGGMEPW
jgi:Mg2+/citrate symporter